MPLAFAPFNNCLDARPPEIAQHGVALRAKVQEQIQRPFNADLSAFLFLPDQVDHPDHEDAAQVFVQAVEQMYPLNPTVGDEIPIFYLGYHAMSRLSGKRASQGFLLTDQAIYVQDEFSVLLAPPPPAQGHVLPTSIADVPNFVSVLLAQYKAWKDWAALSEYPESVLPRRCSLLLEPVIRAVMEYHSQHRSHRQAQLREWELAELVSEYHAGDAARSVQPKAVVIRLEPAHRVAPVHTGGASRPVSRISQAGSPVPAITALKLLSQLVCLLLRRLNPATEHTLTSHPL